MKRFLYKLNWRLILNHLVATWLFICAFKVLGYLKDFDFFNEVVGSAVNMKNFSAERLSIDLYWIGSLGLIGALIAFICSFIISKKNNWYWANSIIVLIAGLVINRFVNIGAYSPVYYISYFLDNWGGKFNSLLVGSIVTMLVAILLLFYRRLINFIDKDTSLPLISTRQID